MTADKNGLMTRSSKQEWVEYRNLCCNIFKGSIPAHKISRSKPELQFWKFNGSGFFLGKRLAIMIMRLPELRHFASKTAQKLKEKVEWEIHNIIIIYEP